jgi:hypothetical protein
MQYGILSRLMALFVYFALSTAILAADQPVEVAKSLHSALNKNITHAREWLDQGDYKSLAQSAGGLQLFAELIRAQSDDAAWQAAAGKVVSAATVVQTAARDEDAAKCKTALDTLEKTASAAAELKPSGQPQSLSRVPALRSLMLTMDATAADAKIALITGNIEAAKKQAAVLAELSRLVSNSRNTERWSSLAGDFTSATTAAATTTESDPKAVRQLFRGISQKCEACHENSRTR